MAALDLSTGEMISHNGDALFAQASSIKIPILVQLFHAERAGKIRMSDSVTLAHKDAVGGSGSIQQRLRPGADVTFTVEGLARAMIVESDNTATNRLIEMLGMDKVNRAMGALGLHETRLRRKMMDSTALERGDENISTPHEMVRLAEMIYRGRVVDRQSCDRMLAILKQVKAAMRAARRQGTEPVGPVTSIVFEHFERLAHSNPYGHRFEGGK